MRLSDQEQAEIRQAITRIDGQAAIYLYGSRVDDAAKGGDIDLLVLSSHIDLMAKLDILAQLHKALGERKIDLAIYPDDSRSFARIAMQSGVRL